VVVVAAVTVAVAVVRKEGKAGTFWMQEGK